MVTLFVVPLRITDLTLLHFSYLGDLICLAHGQASPGSKLWKAPLPRRSGFTAKKSVVIMGRSWGVDAKVPIHTNKQQAAYPENILSQQSSLLTAGR